VTSTATPAISTAQTESAGVNPWVRFLIRRLGSLAISVWVLVTFAFLIIHLIPGDPVQAALGLTADPGTVAAMRHDLGLDQPLLTQYVHFIGDLLHGDLGTSLASRLPVTTVIAQRAPNTILLALCAFVVIVLIAVPLGIGMAIMTQHGRRRGLELGYTSAAVVIAGIPDFVLGVALVWLFAVSLDWLPIAGMEGPTSFILPVLAMSLGAAAALSRLIRVETLSVMGEDFVRTARAKRLRSRLIYLRHAVPNALTATLTLGGLLLSGLVASTVLIENIFAWPGLGPTLVSSILTKDYPMATGLVLMYGGIVLVVNLMVDITLALIDPRSMIREA
jgi:ABC-type dipeptide/oligopeptide/nickel transport system permease component